MGDVLTQSCFPRHEFTEETLPAIETEYNQAHHDPTVIAIDLAHQLAFRNALGNPLFANPQAHSPGSHQAAIDYARSTFSQTDNQVVVGRGIDSQTLLSLVDSFKIDRQSTTLKTQSSAYYGGDSRVFSRMTNTFVLAFRGGPSTEPEYTVLQHLLGSEVNSVKWSPGNSPLSSLPVNSFHLPYSDIGLFGLIVRAPIDEIKSAGAGAVSELKKVAAGQGVEQDKVTRAIKKAQLLLACRLDGNATGSEILGAQVLCSNSSPNNHHDLYSAYSGVTPEKVVRAAKSVLSSRPSTVAVGDTQKMPYVDDFGL